VVSGPLVETGNTEKDFPMNELTPKPQGTAIGGLKSGLLSGIRQSRQVIMPNSGKPFLRLIEGAWVYGQNDDPVQVGSTWAVNPNSISHGYCNWTNKPGQKNTLNGEVMTFIGNPLPAFDELPQFADGEWKFQRWIDLACINGVDAGTEVRYKLNNIGATQAGDDFLAALEDHLTSDEDAPPVALIQLDAEPYHNRKYNKKIWNPILTIVGWTGLDDNGKGPGSPAQVAAAAAAEPGDDEDDAPFEPEVPKGKVAKAAKPPISPAPTSAARTAAGRRRPSAA
jgi:hypothetical protein